MIRKISLAVLLTAFIQVAFTQSSKDFEASFNKAIDSYRINDLGRATLLFTSLAQNEHNKNAYRIDAQYYVALCVFKSGDSRKAMQLLLQMMNNNPDWKYKEDVLYLLGNIAFESEDYAGSLEFLKSCTSKNIQLDVFNMKKYYLHKCGDIEKLKQLHQNYPDDEALAIVLAYHLTQKSFLRKDESYLLSYLMQTFVFDEELKAKIAEMESRGKKDVYNVAVLFPFKYEKLQEFRLPNKNQFALDMYNGMKLGFDELAENDISINLVSYDTKGDTNELKTLLASKEMKQVDLIIGPIYKHENKIAQRFCNENGVVKINPMAKIPIPEDSTYGLYYAASEENMATRMAEFCYNNVTQKDVFLVGYQNNKHSDSAYVKAFTQAFEDLGGKNVKVKYFGIYSQILKMLENEKLDTSNTRAIVSFAHNSKYVSNLSSYYTVQRSEIPFITTHDFIRSPQFVATGFRYANVYSTYSDYIPKEQLQEFDEKYMTRFGSPTNKYSCMGYELACFFGNNLNDHGRFFQNKLIQLDGISKGKLYPGFNYFESNSNSHVEMAQMVDYELIPYRQVKEQEENNE